MSIDRQMRLHYLEAFPAPEVNRFLIKCPDCKQGCNSKAAGGNEKCFHCDVCGLVECEVTSPALDYDEEDDNG